MVWPSPTSNDFYGAGLSINIEGEANASILIQLLHADSRGIDMKEMITQCFVHQGVAINFNLLHSRLTSTSG